MNIKSEEILLYCWNLLYEGGDIEEVEENWNEKKKRKKQKKKKSKGRKKKVEKKKCTELGKE